MLFNRFYATNDAFYNVQPEGNLFRDRFLNMQQRALIEPRVPVLWVFPYILLCRSQPDRNVFLDIDQRSAGGRPWSTKNMRGSGLSEMSLPHLPLPPTRTQL